MSERVHKRLAWLWTMFAHLRPSIVFDWPQVQALINSTRPQLPTTDKVTGEAYLSPVKWQEVHLITSSAVPDNN